MIVGIKINLKKFICYVLVFTVLFSANLIFANSFSKEILAFPQSKLCVVLDAGHGGIDGGCQGVNTKVYERDITLNISKKLQTFLVSAGAKVVQTRTTNEGLYGAFASGFKMRDLNARKEIIKKSEPNLVVSIHLNSFADKSASGALVYYKKDDQKSKLFADKMQQLFYKNLNAKKTESTMGDFFILNCTSYSGVLCECGFLSNPEEEKLLITDEYQQKVAYQIFCGIMAFFEY